LTVSVSFESPNASTAATMPPINRKSPPTTAPISNGTWEPPFSSRLFLSLLRGVSSSSSSSLSSRRLLALSGFFFSFFGGEASGFAVAVNS